MSERRQGQRFGLLMDELDVVGFSEWLFCPGMLFQAAGKWWKDKGARERRHEGLDLLLYRDREGVIRRIDETFKIPVLADGEVAGIIGDFLGKTIIVEHPSPDDASEKILSLYGHTAPGDGIHPGVALKKGDIIASVSGPGRSSFAMTPHLHVTIARTRQSIVYARLNWAVIGGSDILILLDPLDFLDCPYRIVGDDHPDCSAYLQREGPPFKQ